MAESRRNGKGAVGRSPKEGERFGDQVLAAELAREALEASGAEGVLSAVRATLGTLAEEPGDLVGRPVLRLALTVMDLPASERHHHARPYGLLEHLLAVGRGAVERLGAARPPLKGPALSLRDRELHLYGAFLAGLFHDLGKVLDLEVGPPGGELPWNPLAEPLAAFYERRGVRRAGPGWLRHRKGRGLTAHALRGGLFLPIVLPRESTEVLGPRLFPLAEAMTLHALGARLSHVPAEAMDVARIVAEVDLEQSREDRRASLARGPRESVPGEPGSLEHHLSQALGAAVRDDLLPLNRSGGLYVLPEALALEVPEGLGGLLGILPAVVLPEAAPVERGAAPARVREEFLGRLAQAKLLPLHGRSGRTVELGVLSEAGAPPRDLAVVVLRRELLPAELPLFRGQIRLEGPASAHPGALGRGGEVVQVADDVSWSRTRRNTRRSTRDRQPLSSHEPEDLRSDSGLYERRVRAELGARTLAEALEEGILSGLLARNVVTGDVFHREGSLWFRWPRALLAILRRKGMAPRPEVLSMALRELGRLARAGSPASQSAEVQVRFHPESRTPERALRVPAALIVFPEDLRARIGEWPHRIEVLSGAPQGAAEAADPEAPGRSEAGVLPLVLFTKIYESVWDLSRMRAVASSRLLDLAEEFRSRLPARRLILAPKYDAEGREVYALFWALTLGARQGGVGAPKQYRYLEGPVTDERIREWGDRRERAAYVEFDRRSQALGRAYHLARQGLSSLLSGVRGKAGSEGAELPPLPPPDLVADLSSVGLSCLQKGWNLARALARMEGEIRAHRESCARAPFSEHLALVGRDDPERGLASSSWVRLGQVPYDGPISTRVLRKLRLPVRLHAPIMAAEKERRRLEKAWSKSAAWYRLVLQTRADVWREAAGLLACRGKPAAEGGDPGRPPGRAR